MSFSADQFMQVKCRFQLCSELDSFESVFSNTERIRLCDSITLDNSSVLIVMVCSNESGNNHIVAYYMERSSHLHDLSQHSQKSADHNSSLSSHLDLNHEKLSPKRTADQQGASKSRIIVKQIYYHNYNEDIAAICFNGDGSKLILINAASTIYLLPIKNILLNLHAKQLKSSQAKSMYFYDASIIQCCTLSQPTAIACWTSHRDCSKSTIVVGNSQGQLTFIDAHKKLETNDCFVDEPITGLKVIRDMYSHSLLVTCNTLRQYRLTLELTERPKERLEEQARNDFIHIERDLDTNSDRKPIPIRFNSTNSLIRDSATRVLTRVLSSHLGSGIASSLFSSSTLKEPASQFLMHDASSDLFVVLDLAAKQAGKPKTSNSHHQCLEPKLLHFYDSQTFYYMTQKPLLICKLSLLNSCELITQVVVTDRLLAVATSHDRCLICSRNCCNLKNFNTFIDLDPLVKEITFSTEEKILKLIKSPVSNDLDGIIDSFLLVTNRSIYSVEARQSCRDMFVNLIDTHLHIRPQSAGHPYQDQCSPFSGAPSKQANFNQQPPGVDCGENNPIVKSFLRQRDEVYDRITYDGSAFSILFKLELNSLYEAYGDKLLMRYQFELAKKFFQMAKFNRSRILEKFLRLASQKERESEFSFLEYITLQEVTKELVKDVDLCNELMGKPAASLKSNGCGKYAEAALRHLDYFRRLSSYQKSESGKFNKQQRETIESVFILFLEAAVDNSTDDTRWIWFGYIKFYLEHIGALEELEADILRLLDSGRIDCRHVVAFYMAIEGETWSKPTFGLKELERGLFKNVFLLRLLEKTLAHLKDDTVYHEHFLDFSMRCCA